MAGVAITGVNAAGGVIIGGGQSFVKVNGKPVSVVGDAVAPHGIGPHAAPKMATGSSIVRIDGKAVCRAGDTATCGHAANGMSWFAIQS